MLGQITDWSTMSWDNTDMPTSSNPPSDWAGGSIWADITAPWNPSSVNTGGSVPSSGVSSGSFWNNLAGALKSIAGPGSILGTRYAVPQLNPGQYIQSGPSGTTMYQQQPGQSSLSLPSSFTSLAGGGSGSLLIIGAIGLVAILALGHK